MSYPYYRWKWNNYPRIGFIERVPIHLDLELTTRCNYKCVMCEHSFNPPEVLDMPFNMATKIIDEFAEKGGHSIKFVYLGEPLLYKRLVNIIRYAKSKGIIETIIATNASLLDYEISKKLIKAGLDWIIYSVDSCQPEVYKQIRVNGNLKIVTRNIRGFYDVRNMLGKKPKITIQIIRQDLNKKEIESGKFEAFWEKYVDEISISALINFHHNPLDFNVLTPDFCCTSPFRRMTIRADGKIAVCCGRRQEAKIIGDIYEDTIEDVWLGDKVNEIRVFMKLGKAHLVDICRNCPARLMPQGERFEKITK